MPSWARGDLRLHNASFSRIMYSIRPSLSTSLRRLCTSAGQYSIPQRQAINLSTRRALHTSRAKQHVLQLPSGRQMTYYSCGPPQGTPVLYIHGHPDSGITITGPLEARLANELNVRWIGPDRPGVGRSTPYDSQKVTDYPADIQALVEHLELPKYYVLGTSGGTGFALACAREHHPGSRLEGVGICAGVGPLECGFDSMEERQRKALEAWRDYPREFQEFYDTEYVPLAQSDDYSLLEDKIRGEFEASFAGEDREIMLQEDTFQQAVASMRQAWCQGAWAHAHGMALHWRPWGFRLEDVGLPGIKLWYGGKDVSTTPAMGRYMAQRLPAAEYVEFPEASHLTIWNGENLHGMLKDLTGQ